MLLQRDIFAIVIRSDGVLSLAVLQADKLDSAKQWGGMFKVPDLTVEQLALPAASSCLVQGTQQCSGWWRFPCRHPFHTRLTATTGPCALGSEIPAWM